MPVEVVGGVPVPVAKKPAGCRCEFPMTIYDNQTGHEVGCPIHTEFYELRKPAPIDEENMKRSEAKQAARANGKIVPPQGGSGTAPSFTSSASRLFGSRIILTHDELAAAVQYYLAHVVFRQDCAPQVQRVRESNGEFEVRFSGRDAGCSEGTGEKGTGAV